MLVAIGATGVLLSLGTHTPVYGWLYRCFLLCGGCAPRPDLPTSFCSRLPCSPHSGWPVCVAALPARWAGLVVVSLVILSNIESLRAPFYYTRFEGIPAVYSLLAREPGRVVLVEVPFYPPQGVFQGTRVRPQFHRALAAADQWLQRLHSRLVSAQCGDVLVLSQRARDSGHAASRRHARHDPSRRVRQ